MNPSVILAILLAALSPAFTQHNPDTALRAAIHKETVDGDLKAAIEQYRKLTQSKNRAIAAQALLRMGQCYEKLGDTEARRAYERLLRDFADQQDSAQAARMRLAALAKPESGDSSSFRPLPGSGYTHAASPDGRFLIQSGPKGELNAFELATHKVRSLSAGPFYQPVVSPDGRQVAFMRRNSAQGDTELRLVNFDGSKERRLWKSDQTWSGGIPQWFPDGKRILILQWGTAGQRRLLSISSNDGEATPLWEAERIYSTRLSPDGNYVTFMRRQRQEPVSDQIWLLRLSDKTETLLLDGQSYVNYPDWAPNGNGVVFLSDRRQPGAAVDLWFLSVSNGKPSSFPMLLKTGVGDMGSDSYPTVWAAAPITRDGTYFLSKQSSALAPEISQVMKIAFDPAAGKVVGAASFVSPKGGDHSLRAAFSRDGKFLVYVKLPLSGVPSLCIQTVESGEEKTVPLSPPPKRLAQALFHPNGQSLFISGIHPSQGEGLYQVDIQTGSWVSLKKPEEKELNGWMGGISPDGRTLYFNRLPSLGMSTAIARDLESGRERVFRSGLNAGFALSPNGQQLASFHPDGNDLALVVYPSAGGPGREIHRLRGERHGNVLYHADGKSILFGAFPTAPGVRSLYRIAVDGGEPQPVGLEVFEEQSVFPRGFRQIQMHPNGRMLVYTAFGADQPQYKTYSLSRFLPGFKPAK